MRKLLAISLSVTLCCVIGCKPDWDKPCRDPFVSNQGFSSVELSAFPFKGAGDTLRYISQNGDSIWDIGLSKSIFCSCVPVKNNPECNPDSAGYENDQFTYADTLGKLTLQVTVYHVDSSMIIRANNSLFHISLMKIGVNDSITWFDSLQFGNRQFYNLQSFTNAGGDSLYYNAGYGVIGLRTATQRFYIYRFNTY
jgi:hypothetical protein